MFSSTGFEGINIPINKYYRKQPCIIHRNLPLKDFRVYGCGLYTIIDSEKTFFQDIGCDGTDIS